MDERLIRRPERLEDVRPRPRWVRSEPRMKSSKSVRDHVRGRIEFIPMTMSQRERLAPPELDRTHGVEGR